MFEFDHLAVSCGTLAEGVAAVETSLGVPMASGGKHPYFGTHNRLLSLGRNEYLEVIAVDPEAVSPGRSRWFDLDHFKGPPRLSNWVLRCNDLGDARERLGSGIGSSVPLSRGNYNWEMAVPESGQLPFDDCHPALIRWRSIHPAISLEDLGCRLLELVIRHPEARDLAERLKTVDTRFRFETGPVNLKAIIATPDGRRVLT